MGKVDIEASVDRRVCTVACAPIVPLAPWTLRKRLLERKPFSVPVASQDSVGGIAVPEELVDELVKVLQDKTGPFPGDF